MRFDDRKIILKDGRQCTLCCTTPDYAAEMIDYLKVTATETPFLLRNPDEVTYTVESEKEILNNMLENAGSVMMMALVDGETAGNASISAVGTRRRVRHRCSLAIALKKKFWGLGIGTAMMEYLIELAGKMGYEQMELEVVDGNDRAKALYVKSGFVETGRNKDAMKYDDGTYRDDIIMCRKVK